MMRKLLLPLLLFSLLAGGETAVARWLPSPFVAPLLLPALLTLALRLPPTRLARFVFLGGLAGEVVSGLPPSTMLVLLVALPLAARALIRRRDLPVVAHGLVGGIAAVLFFTAVQALAPGPFAPPTRLLAPFIATKLLSPAVVTGTLVLFMSALLGSWARRRLPPLDLSSHARGAHARQ